MGETEPTGLVGEQAPMKQIDGIAGIDRTGDTGLGACHIAAARVDV